MDSLELEIKRLIVSALDLEDVAAEQLEAGLGVAQRHLEEQLHQEEIAG